MAQVEEVTSVGCPSNLAPPADNAENVACPDAFVRQDGEVSRLELAIFGAKCAGCIAKIEGAVKKLPGIDEARLNLSTGKLRVSWHGKLQSQEVVNTVSGLGYRVAPYDPEASEKETDEHGRLLIRCLAVAGFAMANIMLLSIGVWSGTGGEMGEGTRALMHFVSALIAIPAAAYAGRPFFMSAWAALRAGRANMDVPISLAVVLAVSYSLFETFQAGEEVYFDAAVMLLFFLLIGRWLDHALRNRARAAARDLLALQALSANRLGPDGQLQAVSAKDIQPGDHILLAAGDRIPVNGRIISGVSEMDVSLVTGETDPVLRRTGDVVEAGVLNVSAVVTMEATATVDNSLVAELARLVEAGQQGKSSYVRLADKAARAYVPIVHTLAAITFLGWLFVFDAGLRVALMNAIAVLIITCPCALGLATPAVQIVATGELFRKGILVKAGDALERLAQVTHFVFDKTGTLTLGKPQLVNAHDLTPAQFNAAAALARASRHPLSRAIVEAAGTGIVATDVKEIPGQGVSGFVNGKLAQMGRAAFVGADDSGDDATGTLTYVALEGETPVALKFEDTLREDAAETVSTLTSSGIRTSLLSGDRPQPVKQLASRVLIEEAFAALTPAEKLEKLNAFAESGERVAMVGDGLNDAPALASAHVSLSPGSAVEAAQSAADYVFQGQGLSAVTKAWRMARRAQRHILQNFAFAALYNCVAAPLAMAGYVTPLIAALAMSGSSLIVTLNALRLKIGNGD
ncbi:MAG: cadmium-translocating P-type ATPase [Aquisalinus sp.]|nr:cadmium-translocating P-type ATPase [Aquisalinus sp.]